MLKLIGEYEKQEVIFIANRKRNGRIVFYVTDAEEQLIKEKMEVANISNREAFLRKMIFDGYILRLDLSDVRKMISLLSNATNNLNQIAKKANETGSIYENDVKAIQAHYDKLWEQSDLILRSISKL